jgi:hypothetical protein
MNQLGVFAGVKAAQNTIDKLAEETAGDVLIWKKEVEVRIILGMHMLLYTIQAY